MLKRINRIVNRSDFLEIKEKGKIFFGPLFNVIVMKIPKTGKRFAFVVSKRISKKAVTRNRIRRLLSVGIKQHLDEFQDDVSMIFLTKQQIVGVGLKRIEEEVLKIEASS